jgi:hypothetical protein
MALKQSGFENWELPRKWEFVPAKRLYSALKFYSDIRTILWIGHIRTSTTTSESSRTSPKIRLKYSRQSPNISASLQTSRQYLTGFQFPFRQHELHNDFMARWNISLGNTQLFNRINEDCWVSSFLLLIELFLLSIDHVNDQTSKRWYISWWNGYCTIAALEMYRVLRQ